jgi:hypothetical protein
MNTLLIILACGTITGCFAFGFSLGTILERKRLITQCEWDLNIMERLSKIEDDDESELEEIKLVKIQFSDPSHE